MILRMQCRFLGFVLPAVCSVFLIGLVACGGSGGGRSTTMPTVQEAATAVREATTPAQGQAAVGEVFSYLGVVREEAYLAMPAETRGLVRGTFGELTAYHNGDPLPLTYGGALETFATTFKVSITVEVALTQLTADLTRAVTDSSTPGREELRLLAELHGSTAVADGPTSPVGSIALARWYAERYVTEPAGLTRKEKCLQECAKKESETQAEIARLYQSLKSAAEDARKGIIQSLGMAHDPTKTATLTDLLRKTEATILGISDSEQIQLTAAKSEYEACTARCHEQG